MDKDTKAATPRPSNVQRRDPLTGKWMTYLGPLDMGITWPRDIPDDVMRGHAAECAALDEKADTLRAALIRLLWRAVADGDGCSCDDGDPRPTDICEAMRVLGWGEHWDAAAFQRKAMSEPGTAPKAPND